MFVCEPSWKYSANLVGSIRRNATKLYSGSKKLCSTCSGNIRPIRQTLPLIGWEQNCLVDEEEIKMDDGVSRFFTHFRGNLLTCWRRSLVLGTQNEIVVSWITLWGMIKVYWLDFSLHFWSCCLLRVCHKFGLKRASHYKPVENEVKLFELSEPCSAN